MNYFFLFSAAAAITGAGHIIADYGDRTKLTYLLKPLTMALIASLVWLKPAQDLTYAYLIFAGLIFSLIGDVFLMLKKDHFIQGLASFLVAHLIYIGAFFHTGQVGWQPFLLLGLLVYGGIICRILWPKLGKLRSAVCLYMAIILVMVYAGCARWIHVPSPSGWAALKGAALFAVSDTILAINRFRRPFKSAQALIMATYYGAQWLIAASVSL